MCIVGYRWTPWSKRRCHGAYFISPTLFSIIFDLSSTSLCFFSRNCVFYRRPCVFYKRLLQKSKRARNGSKNKFEGLGDSMKNMQTFLQLSTLLSIHPMPAPPRHHHFFPFLSKNIETSFLGKNKNKGSNTSKSHLQLTKYFSIFINISSIILTTPNTKFS